MTGRDMKRRQPTFILVLASLIFPWGISSLQQSATAANVAKIAKLPTKATQVLKSSTASTDSTTAVKNISPRISFEKTVCDLGEVGQGTRNTCEFRFTNTGRGLLKIGNISRTCGCTVFQLDMKEYAPNEIGAIDVN